MFNELKGQCIGCKKMYLDSLGARHLLSCKDIEKFLRTQSPSGSGYILKISSLEEPNTYWMFITVPLNEELSFLDQFLRNIWLECCGHLSVFTIEDDFYSSNPEPGDLSMNKKLEDILYPGLNFSYTYDLEDPTDLEITVIGQSITCSSKKVNILMRNEESLFECENCSEKAERVCGICFETVCQACIPVHECVEEEEGETYMILPLVNSPRVGICGYEGEKGPNLHVSS